MVDIIKIAMMVVALILVVLIPVLAFFHFRKKPQLSQGLLWGLISFLAFGIIRTILMMLVTTVIFPSPAEGIPNALLASNGLVSGLVNASIGAISFVAAGLIMYRFQLKRVDDKDLPVMNSLVFNIMSAMSLISQIIQYIMISINANAGNLEKYVNPEVTIEAVKELVMNINSISAVSYFDLGFSRWLEVVVFAIAFTLLYRYMKEKDSSKSAINYVLVTLAVVFSYLLVGSLAINFLATTPIVEVLVKVVFVLVLYFGFKKYDESYSTNDPYEVDQIN